MDQLLCMPIAENWTADVAGDPSDVAEAIGADAVEVATIAELAAALGQYDVADLEPWRIAINAVGAELAALDQSVDWSHSASTPTVVLLRSLGRLACTAPDVESPLAAALIAAVTGAET